MESEGKGADIDKSMENENTTDSIVETTDNLNISSNLEEEIIDEDTRDKLRGDLVGDTMYSESFIIKTLLRFNNFKWDDDFETDLCFLWDMTVEKDVCDLLFSLSFPSLACDVILNESECRLIEIIIGVMGNICIPDNTPELKLEEIEIVLSFLSTDDPLILVQVVRFLKVVSYKAKDKIEFINDNILKKLTFILANSMNVQLLDFTLDALHKITSDNKLYPEYINGELVKSSLDAIKTICDSEEGCEYNVYKSEKVKSAVTHWLQILVNLAVYANIAENMQISMEVCKYEDEITSEVCNILHSFKDDEDEFDFRIDDLIFVIESLNYFAPIFNFKCDKMLYLLLHILTYLIEIQEINVEFCNAFIEVICFAISLLDLNDFRNVAQADKDTYLKGLNFIKNYSLQLDFQYETTLDGMMTLCEGNTVNGTSD